MTLTHMTREFNEVLQAGSFRAVIGDTTSFIEAVCPPQHDDHVKEFKITRKLVGWNVSTDDLLADLRRGRA